MKTKDEKLRVVAWGTYDLGKPRDRILLRGLRENGVDVLECHSDVWQGIEDKSQVAGWHRKARLAGKSLLAYPSLIVRYLRLPKHDAVLVPYMGQLDVLVLWPFAKLRRRPIIWDAFLSLYNTIVEDRQLIRPGRLAARLLFAWEWLACRAADIVLVDTNAHGRYFIERFRLPATKVQRIFVGAEPEHFYPSPEPTKPAGSGIFQVLFYGQFIPLHGIETIIRAAKLSEGDKIAWHLVGTGQEAERIRALIDELNPSNVDWEPWVPYHELLQRIHAADVCLGIFGTTEKASRVIPNKVFQVIASGRPLITADTPAARELLEPGPAVELIPPADPDALRRAVLRMRAAERHWDGALCQDIQPNALVKPFKDLIMKLRPANSFNPPL